MVIITGHKKHFLPPSTETGHHPMAPVEAEHPPTARFSLQKKMSTYFIFHLDQCPAVHGWRNSLRLKANRTEPYTDKLLAHLNHGADPAQQNHHPATFQLWTLPVQSQRLLWDCGWASLTNQSVWGCSGTAEASIWHHRTGKLRSSFVWGHSGTRPARHRTKCWDLTTTAVKGSTRKTHPGLPQAAGNHVAMLSPCWGCRDIQDAPDVNNIQRWEWQWGKINAESNSKDLIMEWQSNQRGFPWASTNSLSSALGTNCPPVTLPRFAEESTAVKKTRNSSPVGPAVWVVETFSATKALTPRESTQCEKVTLKEGEMTILLPN